MQTSDFRIILHYFAKNYDIQRKLTRIMQNNAKPGKYHYLALSCGMSIDVLLFCVIQYDFWGTWIILHYLDILMFGNIYGARL